MRTLSFRRRHPGGRRAFWQDDRMPQAETDCFRTWKTNAKMYTLRKRHFSVWFLSVWWLLCARLESFAQRLLANWEINCYLRHFHYVISFVSVSTGRNSRTIVRRPLKRHFIWFLYSIHRHVSPSLRPMWRMIEWLINSKWAEGKNQIKFLLRSFRPLSINDASSAFQAPKNNNSNLIVGPRWSCIIDDRDGARCTQSLRIITLSTRRIIGCKHIFKRR